MCSSISGRPVYAATLGDVVDDLAVPVAGHLVEPMDGAQDQQQRPCRGFAPVKERTRLSELLFRHLYVGTGRHFFDGGIGPVRRSGRHLPLVQLRLSGPEVTIVPGRFFPRHRLHFKEGVVDDGQGKTTPGGARNVLQLGFGQQRKDDVRARPNGRKVS